MIILLTNDDGLGARGISELEEVLSAEHDVYVIAPHEERSGSSNAFTIREPVILTRHDDRHFSLNGYPTDCVNVGLKAGIIPYPDLVVSGINHGPNLGDDIFFSGTVGAARMARICGLSGIAVSLNSMDPLSPYFHDAASFVLSFIESGFKKNDILFNINYPSIPRHDVKGIRYALLTKRNYGNSFSNKSLPDGRMSLQLIGGLESIPEEGTDADFVKQGFVTITPLSTDCCDYDSLDNNEEQNG
ncbi:MAG: 5'/3'-nucleotidase SurE [Spirochaetia bacterium]|jgi:5'-nucleotidase|nr:5'/3'-nucleotidase SurE [Spirochaetia bacterium]